MSYPELRKSIIDWLDDNYHFGEAATLIKSDEASFLDTGVLTSLGFVQLCLFLEKKYRIKIDRKSLTRENFDSLGKITRYVTGHKDYKGSKE
jgi:acyl carrier protein